jgi:RNA polymerase sigma-70 factor (ECF subfamily)
LNTKDYNSIVDALSDNLFRYAIKTVRQEADAHDVVQHCFERLWINRDKVDPSKVKSYLFSTAHNFIIDMFRKNKRTSYEEVLPEQGYQPQSHNDELKEMLDKCLVQLSEIQRSVLLLRDYEGYNYQEIADMTQLNESQVKVYIFRARQKMQQLLTVQH